MRQIVCRLSVALLLCSLAGLGLANQGALQGSVVELEQRSDGSFALLRNGKPYQVKGAGYGGGNLELLKALGGNSIRTWGVSQLEQIVDGKALLDRAHELGLTVSAGFWVNHLRHGFDYGNPVDFERQRNQLREAVMKYKDHPALLVWNLGNEMEAFLPEGADVTLVWKELDHLAGMIKEMDPDHPVMTTIASAGPDTIESIKAYYPNLDILGVNAYSGASTVGRNLPDAGWDGPYMLTEFGVTGTWEVAKTPWSAPVEADPSSKAADSYAAYTLDRDRNIGRSLGSYVFIWGDKQEATFSWFSMFLPSGEKLPRVDAMAYAWTGEWPKNRAPKLRSLNTEVAFKRVKAGSSSQAKVDVLDREGDQLSYTWDIRAESSDRRVGGDSEAVPRSFPELIKKGQGTERIEFSTPGEPGAYRIFVTAFDGKGGATVHNLPFYVEQ
jgi:hypothetical protein